MNRSKKADRERAASEDRAPAQQAVGEGLGGDVGTAHDDAHTLAAHDGWEFRPGQKSMVAMPLFHVGGSSYAQFGIHFGIPSIMTREVDGASLAGALLACAAVAVMFVDTRSASAAP